MGNNLNNNKELPTLLDMALSYEDGNEGYIQPQYDGYKKTYENLSDDEKNFLYLYPILAYKFNNNANKARSAVENFPNKKDGYGDAIRHCYWCALNQVSAGLNSSLAKEFGDAHESNSGNDLRARAMDIHNNAVGYELGNQAIINGWSEKELLDNVKKAANNGKLYMLK